MIFNRDGIKNAELAAKAFITKCNVLKGTFG